jgi:mono/diheme cytochrome c family protein
VKRLAALSLAAAAALAGCSLAEDVTPPPGLPTGQPVRPAFVSEPTAALPTAAPDLAAGAALYADHCAPCHGASGLGDGPQSGNLPVAPARLADPALARTASLASWYQMVTAGNLERFMPGFQSLSDQERWDVAAYALTLSTSVDEVEQGRAIYGSSGCVTCHTTGGPAPTLSASSLAESTGEDIFQAITNGVANGEMPAFGDTLSEDQRWALAAYLRSVGPTSAGVSTPAPTTTPATTLEGTGTPPPGASPTPSPTSEPSPTSGAVTGMIRGQVTNGTDGGPAAAALQIALRGVEAGEEVVSETAPLGANGEFVFDGLEIVPGRLFTVSVEYEGVTYESDPAHLVSSSPVLELPLTVYETTSDLSTVSVAQLHLIVSSPLGGSVRGIEVWVFSNSGDRAVLPADGGPLLEVALPEGAVLIQSSGGELAGHSGQSPNGFQYSLGVPPGVGTAQLAVVFDVPFANRLELSQPVEFPINSVILLTETGGLVPRGGAWDDLGPVDMGGVSVEQFSTEAPAAGQTLDLTLVQGTAGATSGSTLLSVGIGAGVLGVALILAGLWWFGRREPTGSGSEAVVAPAAVPGAMDRESLLRAIAQLDDEFEAGKIGEGEYRVRRRALKERAIDQARGARD